MILDADFTSQEFFRNPTAQVEKLRAAGPIVEVRFPLVGKVWTTTTQDLANQVLRDIKTFTLRKDDAMSPASDGGCPGVVRTIADNMLTTDEPDHTRLRSIVDEVFRRRAVYLHALQQRARFPRRHTNAFHHEVLYAGTPGRRPQG
jgi:cytochrome P450 PksS